MAAALCLNKTQFGRVIISCCFGGPLGLPAAWRYLPEAIAKATGVRHVYFWFRCDLEAIHCDPVALSVLNWRRPQALMGPNLTLVMGLALGEDLLLARASKN